MPAPMGRRAKRAWPSPNATEKALNCSAFSVAFREGHASIARRLMGAAAIFVLPRLALYSLSRIFVNQILLSPLRQNTNSSKGLPSFMSLSPEAAKSDSTTSGCPLRDAAIGAVEPLVVCQIHVGSSLK